jgi:flagellar hook-basal body complex protein FliE
MPLPINPISPPATIAPLPSSVPAKTGASGGFQSVLTDAISRVDQVQQNSKTVVDRFLSGEDEEVHKVALAAQEAEINFDLFMQIRNKVVSAYQEVMRMQM